MADAPHIDCDCYRAIDSSLHPVTWRWQPPVLSPISPRALIAGLGAACGLRAAAHDNVVAALRQRYGASDALLTDSGTSALILALRALLPRGGTIAYPGYGCIDLTAAALHAGVRVRLYDLDPNTLSPDLESIREVIRRGIDAIVVAHLYGYPADVGAVRELAEAHGVPVIEDAAQGAGGTLHGARLGAVGDISILSFGRGKGMTCGSGGAVLVRTPALMEWMRRTRDELGVAPRGGSEIVGLAAQWVFAHPLLYRLPASIPALQLGKMVYHPPRKPRAMPVAAAAILPLALLMDEGEIKGRRYRANCLISRMSAMRNVDPIRPVSGGESGYLRLAFLDVVGDRLPNASLGAVRGYPVTLDEQEQLQPILAARERAGSGAVLLRNRLFTVPTHSRVVNDDVGRLDNWLVATSSISGRDNVSTS